MNTQAKILVTGGAGFIGSHLVDELITLGHKVVVLDDLSGGFKENVNSSALFVEGSINDAQLVQDLFTEHKFDYVYHLAAYAAEGLSHFIKSFNYHNNLLGSINLINASVNNNVKCFVFTSSIAVYGANQLPMLETTTPKPEDSYGIAKYAIELELKACKEMFGLDYIIFRPHNVYGERQNIGDKYRNVLGIFMNQIMQDKPITIFGDGTQKRAFTYVKGVTQTMAKAINIKEAYNQVFNIGADEPYSVNDIVKYVFEAMEKEVEIKYLEARNEVHTAYSDHSKVRLLLAYEDAHSLAEGVKKMATWAKKHGARETKVFSNIEILKNLPASWRIKDEK